MKVLLLHPEDVPWRGDWASAHWDLIVDLGFAGAGVYREWGQGTGARIISLHQFAGQTESYRWVNQAVKAGRGKLLDRMGLDWWELLAPWKYHELQALYLLGQLRREIGRGACELAATRYHPYVHLFSIVTGQPIRCLQGTSSSSRSLISRFSTAARNLRPAQVVEIAFDKWDSGYWLRSKVTKHRRVHATEPLVLLPSAYSNVTRTQLAYAAHLPTRRFLLATTRRSGESDQLPPNVDSSPLAAYVPNLRDTSTEAANLINTWDALQAELSASADLRASLQANLWDYFPRHLQQGLRLRDAWHSLISSEPVKAVLCADDLNYYTRLPLILAKRSGLKSIYCYHGALDGGLLFKKSYADLNLVKGEMEREYMLRVSDVDPERVVIAAPAEDALTAVAASDPARTCDLAFFSQPYEVLGGRTASIYGEILPRLVEVARQLNCKVIVKLHPFESRRGRERLLRSLLPPEQRTRIEVSSAPASEILPRTLCGVGPDSTVCVECAQHSIPYFLCGWLDFNGFGYMQQFARFGAGILLETPDEILSIPQKLADVKSDRSRIQHIWHSVDDAHLDQIIFQPTHLPSFDKCAC
jgi:hypothetical protein